jgi:23S rRNA-intervening sequence protein
LAADRWKEANVFSHEKLNVYQKALTCVAGLARHSRSWDKRHAVVDQLLRASESIVLNLVEGARLRGAARQLDKLGTSVVLNIAEGNGRYLEGDQRKFLDIAGPSVCKGRGLPGLILPERRTGAEPKRLWH